MQLAQLLFVHHVRRLCEQTLRALRFRKRDYIAYRFRTGHHGDNAIQAEGNAAVRWRAVLQGLKQETEFCFGFFGVDAQRGEHFGLHLLTVNTHRAATDFPAVQHHVVRDGARCTGVGFEQVFVPGSRRGERMMHGVPALAFFVPLEHREVEHPQRLPFLAGETFFVANLGAQRTQGFVDNFRFVRAEENQIAVFRTGAFNRRFQRCLGEIFNDRRLQTGLVQLRDIVDLDVRQPFGTVDFAELGIGVDFTACERGATRHQQARHAATRRVGGAGEHFESDVFHRIRQLGEL